MRLPLSFPSLVGSGAPAPCQVWLCQQADSWMPPACPRPALGSHFLNSVQRLCLHLVSTSKLQNCTSSLSREYEFSKGSVQFCKKARTFPQTFPREPASAGKAELLLQPADVANWRKVAEENPAFCTGSI